MQKNSYFGTLKLYLYLHVHNSVILQIYLWKVIYDSSNQSYNSSMQNVIYIKSCLVFQHLLFIYIPSQCSTESLKKWTQIHGRPRAFWRKRRPRHHRRTVKSSPRPLNHRPLYRPHLDPGTTPHPLYCVFLFSPLQCMIIYNHCALCKLNKVFSNGLL